MRHAVLFVALLGCSSPDASEPIPNGGGKADSYGDPTATGPVTYVDRNFDYWVREVECAANQGSTKIGMFSPQTFSASEMLDAIKAEDVVRGCPDRTYSTSRASAVAAFESFLTEESMVQELQDRCAEYGTDVPAMTTALKEAVADPTNVAVFSSVHDTQGADDPVGCFYFRFYVLRASGTAARLYFDWSD
jgi:hypothetical protein